MVLQCIHDGITLMHSYSAHKHKLLHTQTHICTHTHTHTHTHTQLTIALSIHLGKSSRTQTLSTTRKVNALELITTTTIVVITFTYGVRMGYCTSLHMKGLSHITIHVGVELHACILSYIYMQLCPHSCAPTCVWV